MGRMVETQGTEEKLRSKELQMISDFQFFGLGVMMFNRSLLMIASDCSQSSVLNNLQLCDGVRKPHLACIVYYGPNKPLVSEQEHLFALSLGGSSKSIQNEQCAVGPQNDFRTNSNTGANSRKNTHEIISTPFSQP
jgi:hypothetical protein